MINYEDCTIQEFMNAKYKGVFDVIDEESVSHIESQYIETAELYDEEDAGKVKYIAYLNSRINFISFEIRAHRKFLLEFGTPYFPAFERLRHLGHILTWNNYDDFCKQLERIESKEKKYIAKVESEIKELNDMRKRKGSGKHDGMSRESFIRTIISLGKEGYVIDKEKTSMEEMAFMVKWQQDSIKSIKRK